MRVFKAVYRDRKGIARESGKVAIEDDEKSRKVIVLDDKGEEHLYTLPRRTPLLVRQGDKIEAGQQLNEGSLYPAELLEVRGRDVRADRDRLNVEVRAMRRLYALARRAMHADRTRRRTR